MRPRSPFLRHNRSALEPIARLERVLAVGRAFLTLTGFVAIYFDSTEPAQFPEATYSVLFAYAIYSVGMLAYIRRAAQLTPRHGRLIHGLDILWTSVLTFVSQGPVSPFFIFFLFVVVAAAYRWGFRETVGTAVLTVCVFLVETGIAAAGPWSETWIASTGFEFGRTFQRVGYLLLTGFLLGYLAEQEKHSRAELAAIADATRQPRVDLGLGGSIVAVTRALRAIFQPAAVDVVIHEPETRRTLLWRFGDLAQPDASLRPRRTLLDQAGHAAWLFRDPGRAWHTAIDDPNAPVTAKATEPDHWPLRREAIELPEPLRAARTFRTVTVVNLGLEGEWQGRIYLFDIVGTNAIERLLHFLEALADHLTPVLTNVFLLRRLRTRAGATERARVARELHDGAIQALLGIELKIEAIRRGPDRTPSRIEADLGEIQHLLRQEVLALRELMQALRPTELDGVEQLPDVLASLVERFRRDTGISARFICNVGHIGLPPAKALEVVRIVQEALVNVRKHSRARNVLVRVTDAAEGLKLVVEDDGCGFAFEGSLTGRELDERRLGPAIIKERVRIAGARLAVESTPGAGARLEVTIADEVHA